MAKQRLGVIKPNEDIELLGDVRGVIVTHEFSLRSIDHSNRSLESSLLAKFLLKSIIAKIKAEGWQLSEGSDIMEDVFEATVIGRVDTEYLFPFPPILHRCNISRETVLSNANGLVGIGLFDEFAEIQLMGGGRIGIIAEMTIMSPHDNTTVVTSVLHVMPHSLHGIKEVLRISIVIFIEG